MRVRGGVDCSPHSLQKPPEASRSLQKPPEASRSLQRLPEASRSLQKPPEASRSLQKPPEASRGLQKPPESRNIGNNWKTLGKLENRFIFQFFLRFFQFYLFFSNIFQFSLVFSNFPIIWYSWGRGRGEIGLSRAGASEYWK